MASLITCTACLSLLIWRNIKTAAKLQAFNEQRIKQLNVSFYNQARVTEKPTKEVIKKINNKQENLMALINDAHLASERKQALLKHLTSSCETSQARHCKHSE